jgi:U3 small nucleolar RNA-associated protein 13
MMPPRPPLDRPSTQAQLAKQPGGAAGLTAPLRPRAVATAVGHAKDINALALAPHDRMAVTGGQDRLVKVWLVSPEGDALSEAASLRGHKRAVWSVAFSPVDKVAASGSGDMTLKVWSVTDFTCLRTLEGHTSSVLKLHFVSRGLQLVSSGSDGLVKLWSVRGSECVCTLDAHEDKVWALDVCEGGAGCELISGSADSVLVRWRDCTAEAEAERSAETALKAAQRQQLSNAMRARQHEQAGRLALHLPAVHHLRPRPRTFRRRRRRLPSSAAATSPSITSACSCISHFARPPPPPSPAGAPPRP